MIIFFARGLVKRLKGLFFTILLLITLILILISNTSFINYFLPKGAFISLPHISFDNKKLNVYSKFLNINLTPNSYLRFEDVTLSLNFSNFKIAIRVDNLKIISPEEQDFNLIIPKNIYNFSYLQLKNFIKNYVNINMPFINQYHNLIENIFITVKFLQKFISQNFYVNSIYINNCLDMRVNANFDKQKITILNLQNNPIGFITPTFGQYQLKNLIFTSNYQDVFLSMGAQGHVYIYNPNPYFFPTLVKLNLKNLNKIWVKGKINIFCGSTFNNVNFNLLSNLVTKTNYFGTLNIKNKHIKNIFLLCKNPTLRLILLWHQNSMLATTKVNNFLPIHCAHINLNNKHLIAHGKIFDQNFNLFLSNSRLSLTLAHMVSLIAKQNHALLEIKNLKIFNQKCHKFKITFDINKIAFLPKSYALLNNFNINYYNFTSQVNMLFNLQNLNLDLNILAKNIAFLNNYIGNFNLSILNNFNQIQGSLVGNYNKNFKNIKIFNNNNLIFIKGSVNLHWFEKIFNGFKLKGKVNFNLNTSLFENKINGNVWLNFINIYHANNNFKCPQLNGKIIINNNLITQGKILSSPSKHGKLHLTAVGNLTENWHIRLYGKFYKLNLINNNGLFLQFNGNILSHISPQNNRIYLNNYGNLNLTQGTYNLEQWIANTLDFEIVENITPSNNKTHTIINININKPIECSGFCSTSKFIGKLKFSHNEKDFLILGRLNLVEGFLALNNNKFNLDKGYINFTVQNPNDPYIYIIHQQSINNLLCKVILSGHSHNLNFSFLSSPNTSAQDILSHILFKKSILYISVFEMVKINNILKQIQGQSNLLDYIFKFINFDLIKSRNLTNLNIYTNLNPFLEIGVENNVNNLNNINQYNPYVNIKLPYINLQLLYNGVGAMFNFNY